VLLATGVTIFLLSLTLSSLVALGIRGPLISTRATLAGSSTTDSSLVVSAAPAVSTSSQDVGVRRVISSTFSGVPILITRARVAASGRHPVAITWTITPDSRRITPSQLGLLAKAFARIDDRVDASAAAHSPGATVSGHGPQTVSQMRTAIAAVDTVLPIPLTVLSLAGVIALLLCARLLSATRENEARLIRARGGSVRTLVLADSTEILLPAVIGVVAGDLVAQAILWYALGAPTSAIEIAIAPLAILVAAVLVSAISGASAARAASGAPRPSSGRAGTAATLSVASLLVIISAIATWRFLQFGTPAVGRPQDVSAIIAPALLLCTAAMVSLLLFFPLTGWLQRAGARKTGMLRVFPARTLHRNPRLFAGPIALLVISVATGATAAGYAATWSGFLGDSTRLVTGSDVRATFGGAALATDASSVLDRAAYTKLSGVRDVVPALRESGTISDENITVMALSSQHVSSIVGPTSSVIDVQSLVHELRPSKSPLNGVALPTGSTSLTVSVIAASSTGGPGSVLTTLWLVDDLGDVAPVALPAQKVSVHPDVSASVSTTVSVPQAGPWHLVAIDAEVTATHALHGFTFGLEPTSVRTASGATALSTANPDSWKAQGAVFNDGSSIPGKAGTIGFSRSTVREGTNTAVRLMPPGSPTVPVVVSRALAEANKLSPGDVIDVEGQWATFSAKVAGVAPLVPGTTSQASLIADLPSLDNGWLRSSEQIPALHELWIAGSSGAPIASEVAKAAEAADDGSARVTAASGSVSRRFVGGAVTGLWLGAAGSAAFAIVTLIASLASARRRRIREVGVLRALGMSGRDQARMRRTEITVVVVFGLLVGLLTGGAMLGLTVGTLARSSTPEAPLVLPLVLRLDLLTPVILIALIVVLSILVIGRYLAVIRRTARVAKP
jgi:hypothetical protein